MWEVKEFVNPYDSENPDFWIKIEHLGRYLFAKNILASLNIKPGLILDAGCGSGYGTKVLCECSEKVVGVDRNHDALYIAKQINNASNAEFFDFDFNEDREYYYAEPFDAIVSFEFLEHIKTPEVVVNNLYNRLKKNGLLICSVPNAKFESTDKLGNPKNPFHLQLFTYERAYDMLANAGFENIERFGQSTVNLFFKKESLLFRKKVISEKASSLNCLHSENVIEYFSDLLGIPDKIDLENSYSFIFVAQKK